MNTSGNNAPAQGMALPIASHQENPSLAKALQRIRFKIFVMSGKGGVGKSSVTVNLAAAMAELGFKTGILDVDLHGPSVPRLLGLAGGDVSHVENDLIVPLPYSEKLKVLSMDTLLQDRNQAVIWRGPKKAGAITQLIAEADWGDLDFLFIDSPPGTGDEHMTILRLVPDALCLIVTTPQEIALADVRKAVNFLQVMHASVLGVVENMGGFPCPHCGGKIDLFQPDGGLELAKHYGLPFLGSIPLDPASAKAADAGVPAVLYDGVLPAKSAYMALAHSLKNACENKSWHKYTAESAQK